MTKPLGDHLCQSLGEEFDGFLISKAICEDYLPMHSLLAATKSYHAGVFGEVYRSSQHHSLEFYFSILLFPAASMATMPSPFLNLILPFLYFFLKL